MKNFGRLKSCLLVLFIAQAVACSAELLPLDSKFLAALRSVETGGKPKKGVGAIGDKGRALGPFQIHRAYFLDAQEFDESLKTHQYKDCAGYEVSVKAVTAYMNRYGRQYIVSSNYEALARLHNAGHAWDKKLSLTDGYWRRVEKALNETR